MALNSIILSIGKGIQYLLVQDEIPTVKFQIPNIHRRQIPKLSNWITLHINDIKTKYQKLMLSLW